MLLLVLVLHSANIGSCCASLGHGYGTTHLFVFFDLALDHLLEILLDLVLCEEVLCLAWQMTVPKGLLQVGVLALV